MITYEKKYESINARLDKIIELLSALTDQPMDKQDGSRVKTSGGGTISNGERILLQNVYGVIDGIYEVVGKK